jgi:hypothetical protein
VRLNSPWKIKCLTVSAFHPIWRTCDEAGLCHSLKLAMEDLIMLVLAWRLLYTHCRRSEDTGLCLPYTHHETCKEAASVCLTFTMEDVRKSASAIWPLVCFILTTEDLKNVRMLASLRLYTHRGRPEDAGLSLSLNSPRPEDACFSFPCTHQGGHKDAGLCFL